MSATAPKTTKSKPQLYAGLDLSLTSPGFAIISVDQNSEGHRIPSLVEVSVIKTDTSETQPLRYEVIEAHALLFFRKYTGLTAIIREVWPPSRNYAQNDKLHGAWSAVDRALSRLGLAVTENLTPSTVKKTVTGKGTAEKPEVAAAVSRILRLEERKWAAGYDDSDACAVALAYLIRDGLIDVR